MLVAGIKSGYYAVALGIAYFIGRILMFIGYRITPGWRRPGVILLNLSLGGLFYIGIKDLMSLSP